MLKSKYLLCQKKIKISYHMSYIKLIEKQYIIVYIIYTESVIIYLVSHRHAAVAVQHPQL
jgi:hypothetical protein